ncbi:DUF881 domain-containing protein [Kineococcus rhizosphaerae]|uniref:Uncharacterized protein YlxW (UPF0749 family) n=1 Tax=Kineococcus rhizosphaerae TaxID=559628 RepID=A0A2T0R9M1_9ACTN|nr:DUF881 domain-containing protein [Kineococcus rhizosphaerae]PRY17821.1 uncharacterized protein YlxW (UPF0749 family) [Kineococcus rhizosphaerae]
MKPPLKLPVRLPRLPVHFDPDRDPAASTRLLTEVMTRPLDPGYAAAARRRAESGEPPARRHRVVTVAALCAIGALFAAAGIRAAAAEPAADRGRAQLAQRIEDGTARADALAAQAAELQAGNARLAAQLGGAPAASADARSAGLEVAAAATAVTGPGVQVVLDDAPTAAEAGGTSGRVVDRDVQLVVNGLWASGAEAVAINGQRLGALSSIRAAGQAVLVDYRPLTLPYTVSAVGDPAAVQTAFATSVAGRYLQVLRDNYGIRTRVSTADHLELPAARLEVRFAQPQGQ